MIDWPGLVANSLWVLALAAALAVVSTASWRASAEKASFREVLGRRETALALLGCLALFCLGVALATASMFEKFAWGVLAVFAVFRMGLVYRKI